MQEVRSAIRDVFALVRGKRVVPEAPPLRRPSVSPEYDGVTSEVSLAGRGSGAAFFINYVDASGAASSRRVTCRRISHGGQTMDAWCHERQAYRCFSVDRIRALFDIYTGEELDLRGELVSLRERGMEWRDERADRVVTALTFLMRCDGHAHEAEHEAVDNAISRYVLRFDGDDALYESLSHRAPRVAPEGGDFARALAYVVRCPEGPRLAQFLSREAAQVIDADGRHAPEEVEFGLAIDRVLARVARRST